MYKTYTTISTIEISSVIKRGTSLMGDLSIDAGYAKLYAMKKRKPEERRLLYLYLYAISSWDVTDLAWNYYGQEQLKILLSAVEQLLRNCKTSEQ